MGAYYPNFMVRITSFVNRIPDSNSQGFILQFLMSDEASLYTKAGKPVAFVLDLMKLDVPDLFASSPHSTTSERFQKDLHTYISSNGLSRDLLENVDKIMVSNHHILCMRVIATPLNFYPHVSILGSNI